MNQREKLIELLDIAFLDSDDNYGVPDREQVADYLIANGVVVLPCRCCECEHCDIGQNDIEQWCICQLHFGKYIDVDPTDFCPYGKRKGGELK